MRGRGPAIVRYPGQGSLTRVAQLIARQGAGFQDITLVTGVGPASQLVGLPCPAQLIQKLLANTLLHNFMSLVVRNDSQLHKYTNTQLGPFQKYTANLSCLTQLIQKLSSCTFINMIISLLLCRSY